MAGTKTEPIDAERAVLRYIIRQNATHHHHAPKSRNQSEILSCLRKQPTSLEPPFFKLRELIYTPMWFVR